MKKKVLIGIIALIILVIVAINWFLSKKEEELIRECVAVATRDRIRCKPPPGGFVICKVGSNDEIISRVENLNETALHCGERIMYSVDLSGTYGNVMLPENFYPCALFDKLLNVTEFRCIEQSIIPNSKTSYVNNGKQVFVCWFTPITPQTPIRFFYKGNIPSEKNEINLVEFYAFPLTTKEISQEYFLNHLNEGIKVYSLQAKVIC
jgi:hypothetical protein